MTFSWLYDGSDDGDDEDANPAEPSDTVPEDIGVRIGEGSEPESENIL